MQRTMKMRMCEDENCQRSSKCEHHKTQEARSSVRKYTRKQPNNQLLELEMLLVILFIVSRSAAMCSNSIPSNFCNDSL